MDYGTNEDMGVENAVCEGCETEPKLKWVVIAAVEHVWSQPSGIKMQAVGSGSNHDLATLPSCVCMCSGHK